MNLASNFVFTPVLLACFIVQITVQTTELAVEDLTYVCMELNDNPEDYNRYITVTIPADAVQPVGECGKLQLQLRGSGSSRRLFPINRRTVDAGYTCVCAERRDLFVFVSRSQPPLPCPMYDVSAFLPQVLMVGNTRISTC